MAKSPNSVTVAITPENQTFIRLQGDGSLSRGIDRIVILLKAATKQIQSEPGEGTVERRQRLKAEKEAKDRAECVAAEEADSTARQKERLERQLKHYRLTGEPEAHQKDSPLMTPELKAEAMTVYKLAKVEAGKPDSEWHKNILLIDGRDNSTGATVEEKQRLLKIYRNNPLTPFKPDAAEILREALREEIAAKLAQPAPPAKALTYAEQLAANPWPKDTDGGDDATAWTGE